jgi:glutamate decarboxylase
MTNLTTTSDWLAEKIASIVDAQGKVKFEILGDNLGGKGLPLVAWKLKDQEAYDGMSMNWTLFSQVFLTLRAEFAIAHNLRSRGWIGRLIQFMRY